MSAARFEADATSIVATEFVTLMDEAAEGRLDEVDLPRALLARRSGRAFAVLLSSELGVYPAAGMDGVRRRKAVLASARAALARELGREPTANQVLEAANARMASRADAAKQGMVFTSADLAPVREAEALPAPGDRAWGVASASADDPRPEGGPSTAQCPEGRGAVRPLPAGTATEVARGALQRGGVGVRRAQKKPGPLSDPGLNCDLTGRGDRI